MVQRGWREIERGGGCKKAFTRVRTTMWQISKENESVARSQLIAIPFLIVNLHVSCVIRFKLHFLAIRW